MTSAGTEINDLLSRMNVFRLSKGKWPPRVPDVIFSKVFSFDQSFEVFSLLIKSIFINTFSPVSALIHLDSGLHSTFGPSHFGTSLIQVLSSVWIWIMIYFHSNFSTIQSSSSSHSWFFVLLISLCALLQSLEWLDIGNWLDDYSYHSFVHAI